MDFKVITGSLLVAGTAIGAGMLALPITTAAGGFWPAFFIYLVCWFFMTATGLLLLEICLWMPQDANLVSMAHHLLGPVGKGVAWVLYLFLFYSLTIAYVAGGGGFFVVLFGDALPVWGGIVLFTLVFGLVIYLGTKAVDRINFLLMIGLIASYIIFVCLGYKHVNVSRLKHSDWGASFFALPIIFTSFSYQGIIPSLTTYFQRDAKKVRYAIIIGTAIPFIAYVIWEFLILGIVPIYGAHGLLDAASKQQTAIYPLKYILKSTVIYSIGQAFAFFALTTSFLGVTLGLFDFLSDGLKIPKEGVKKIFLWLIVYIPPLIIALVNPSIFLTALNYAGGFGCALLLGLLPVIMVWVGRYKREFSPLYIQVPGGRPLLSCLALFVFFEVIIELMHEIH